MIPIYTAEKALIRYVSEEELLKNLRLFRLIRNKRGHIKRAYMLPDAVHCDFRPNSSIGISFQQHLSGGMAPVWALGGVRGS